MGYTEPGANDRYTKKKGTTPQGQTTTPTTTPSGPTNSGGGGGSPQRVVVITDQYGNGVIQSGQVTQDTGGGRYQAVGPGGVIPTPKVTTTPTPQIGNFEDINGQVFQVDYTQQFSAETPERLAQLRAQASQAPRQEVQNLFTPAQPQQQPNLFTPVQQQNTNPNFDSAGRFKDPFFSVQGQRERLANAGDVLRPAVYTLQRPIGLLFGDLIEKPNYKFQALTNNNLFNKGAEFVANRPFVSAGVLATGIELPTFGILGVGSGSAVAKIAVGTIRVEALTNTISAGVQRINLNKANKQGFSDQQVLAGLAETEKGFQSSYFGKQLPNIFTGQGFTDFVSNPGQNIKNAGAQALYQFNPGAPMVLSKFFFGNQANKEYNKQLALTAQRAGYTGPKAQAFENAISGFRSGTNYVELGGLIGLSAQSNRIGASILQENLASKPLVAGEKAIFKKAFARSAIAIGKAGAFEGFETIKIIENNPTRQLSPSLAREAYGAGFGALTAGTIGGYIFGRQVVGKGKLAQGIAYATDFGELPGDILDTQIGKIEAKTIKLQPPEIAFRETLTPQGNKFYSSVNAFTDIPGFGGKAKGATFTQVNINPISNTNTETESNPFVYTKAKANANAFTNVFTNVNTNPLTNVNTNTDVNTNPNANTNTNPFVNTNANTDTQTNVNTDVNTNIFTNVNTNVFTPIGRNLPPLFPTSFPSGGYGGGGGRGGKRKAYINELDVGLNIVDTFSLEGVFNKANYRAPKISKKKIPKQKFNFGTYKPLPVRKEAYQPKKKRGFGLPFKII